VKGELVDTLAAQLKTAAREAKLALDGRQRERDAFAAKIEGF
jgi:hypothetical protein